MKHLFREVELAADIFGEKGQTFLLGTGIDILEATELEVCVNYSVIVTRSQLS